MPNERAPDLSLFVDILHTLESIGAPYMIIGAFAGTVYGITRVTYDIDIVVELSERHIQALTTAYPLPRYYADPMQMRDSIRRGIMFNIIDTGRGEKADLVPLTLASRYREAFQRRVRQTVDIPGAEPFEVWCARPEDIIVGKLMAWAEGRSRKHETDIYEMMVFHYLGVDPALSAAFDQAYIDARAKALGVEAYELWEATKGAARREASRTEPPASSSTRRRGRREQRMDKAGEPTDAPQEDTVEALCQRLGRLHPRQVAAWQAMSPARRLEMAFQAYQFALDAVRLTERQNHPDLSPEELAWRVTRRMQGNPRLGR